jgi:beta-glucosidase
VVQVYVAAPEAAGEPPKQLKGFAKVSVDPGRTTHVDVTLEGHAFSVWDTGAKKWATVPGAHTVLVGDSSRSTPLRATVTVA